MVRVALKVSRPNDDPKVVNVVEGGGGEALTCTIVQSGTWR